MHFFLCSITSASNDGVRENKRKNMMANLEMKESGFLDLKTVRKDNILPMKGKPRSPGGREDLL